MRILGLILSFALLGAADAKKIEVSAEKGWVDTGLDVQAGDLMRFEATGSLQYKGAREAATPDGLARGWRDLVRALPLNDAGRGALLGRIGADDGARPFLVGAKRDVRMAIAGRLWLGLNQSATEEAGTFTVSVKTVEHGKPVSPAVLAALPPITEEILGKIPRRVVDAAGNEGDRVNFLILGPEEQLKSALTAVGWVAVDRTPKDSLLRGTLATLSKQAYLTMPMSELMVFGRAQDYGFALSDPLRTVMTRHHFRVWKAPFDVGAHMLWVGAGTHDTGFDRDQRTGGVTHKIDPETDKEREFIGQTLRQSGQVLKVDYITPKDTITKAKTAHGEEFSSDGRILIIYLNEETAAKQ
jgi:hypothetical protein